MRQSIVRVQHVDDGRGPWRPGFSRTWIDIDAPVGRLSETILDLMPAAQLGNLPRDQYYGCGCRSLSALWEWFTPKERASLKRLGYYPVRIGIDAVLAESQWQVLFARREPLTIGVTRLSWPTGPC